jgi:uncharacterized membrane protein
MKTMEGKTALGLEANLGALICYLGNFICSFGLIYSIIVIVTDKTNKFVRFHAWQSILCSVLGGVFGVIAGLGGVIAYIVDAQLGFPILTAIIGLVALVVGLVLVFMFVKAALKAYKGEIYKMPIVGGFADKWA